MATDSASQRKVVVFNMITLDGFFEGPNADISWHNTDGEFNEFAINQLHTVGALIFGRVTYDLMASYWPTEGARADDPAVSSLMNSLPKFVFSKTLGQADWSNTTLARGNLGPEVTKLKRQPGQDLFIFGSGKLVADLAELD